MTSTLSGIIISVSPLQSLNALPMMFCTPFCSTALFTSSLYAVPLYSLFLLRIQSVIPSFELMVSLPSASSVQPSLSLPSIISACGAGAASTVIGAAFDSMPAVITTASSSASILFRKLPFLLFIIFQPPSVLYFIESCPLIPSAPSDAVRKNILTQGYNDIL